MLTIICEVRTIVNGRLSRHRQLWFRIGDRASATSGGSSSRAAAGLLDLSRRHALPWRREPAEHDIQAAPSCPKTGPRQGTRAHGNKPARRIKDVEQAMAAQSYRRRAGAGHGHELLR